MHCKTCGDWTCKKIGDMHHLMAYATEEDVGGNFHYHDRNGRWQEWECSKGHTFRCVAYNQCWCGWTSQYPEYNMRNSKMLEDEFGGIDPPSEAIYTYSKIELPPVLSTCKKCGCTHGMVVENRLTGEFTPIDVCKDCMFFGTYQPITEQVKLKNDPIPS